MLNRKINYPIGMLIIFTIILSTGAAGFGQPDLDKINNYRINSERDIVQQGAGQETGIFKVLFSLVFISALIFATYRFLRMLKLDRSIGTIHSRYMKVIDFMPLGINRGVYILKVVNDFYAVLAFEKGMQVLCKITDDISSMETCDIGLSKPGFKDVLKRVFKTKLPDYQDSYFKNGDFSSLWQKLNNLSGFRKTGNGKKEGSEDEKQ